MFDLCCFRSLTSLHFLLTLLYPYLILAKLSSRYANSFTTWRNSQFQNTRVSILCVVQVYFHSVCPLLTSSLEVRRNIYQFLIPSLKPSHVVALLRRATLLYLVFRGIIIPDVHCIAVSDTLSRPWLTAMREVGRLYKVLTADNPNTL